MTKGRRPDPNYHRAYMLKSQYGLTVEDYDVLLASQGGVCAICGDPPKPLDSGKFAPLHVDHDHTTLKIRGLLCSSCNAALGLLKDDLGRLRHAIEYLLASTDSTGVS